MVQESNGVSSNMADIVLPISVVATPLTRAATPLTLSTIQPIVVQLSVQDTPSASGSSCRSLACRQLHPWHPMQCRSLVYCQRNPLLHSSLHPLLRRLRQRSSLHPLLHLSCLLCQLGLTNGLLCWCSFKFLFSEQSVSLYMSSPSWEASQREQILQNQLLQQRHQFEAWKARHAQPQVAQSQAPPPVPLEPTVIVFKSA